MRLSVLCCVGAMLVAVAATGAHAAISADVAATDDRRREKRHADMDNSVFLQMLCYDSTCNSGCSSNVFNQGVCLQMVEQQSGRATCNYDENALVIRQYILSPNCTGAYTEIRNTLNQCYPAAEGKYVEYVCPSQAEAAAARQRKAEAVLHERPPAKHDQQQQQQSSSSDDAKAAPRLVLPRALSP